MLYPCLQYKRNTESKNRRIVLLSKCEVCNSKKLIFLKEREARWLWNNLVGIKAPTLSDLSMLNTLFWKCKRNVIINRLLLAADKFMPEMHLKQRWFTYNACGTFTKNKERMKKVKKQHIQILICKQQIFIKMN